MLLSEIEFGSFLAYSPRGEGKVARRSQVEIGRIKRDAPREGVPVTFTSEHVANRLKARIEETPFAEWLTPRTLLIPTPPSALLQANSLWVPYRIAQAMVRIGLGGEALPGLRRNAAVRKSATAKPEERPRADHHYNSMGVERLAFPHDDVIVLDDVVTRGATLIAAVSRVQEALPGARVRAFAIVRTLSDATELADMFAPVVGTITRAENGQTYRRP